MSAVGKHVGVISLGMSCQSARQIRTNLDVIARAFGDGSLKASGMPFDNIICRPEAAIRMLAADTFHPADPVELSISEGAFWGKYDVYFWHEYDLRKKRVIEFVRKKLHTERAYRELSEKYSYMSNKFRRLAAIDRLIFVISNTQNNLNDVKAKTGMDCVVSMAAVEKLCDQCDDFFGKPCEYIFATYDDRVTGHSRRDNLALFMLTPDDSDWTGDQLQWRALFESYSAR